MELVKKITIGTTEYVLTFPQTGREQMSVLSKQSEYSEGKYLDLLSLNTNASFYQWQLINTASLLDSIAPLIAKEMNDGEDISVMDLPSKKSKILVKTYIDELENWYIECEKECFGDE